MILGPSLWKRAETSRRTMAVSTVSALIEVFTQIETSPSCNAVERTSGQWTMTIFYRQGTLGSVWKQSKRIRPLSGLLVRLVILMGSWQVSEKPLTNWNLPG